jgi:hypothetical protein
MMRRNTSVSRLGMQMCRHANLLVQGGAVCLLAWTAGCSVDDKVSASMDAPEVVNANETVGFMN